MTMPDLLAEAAALISEAEGFDQEAEALMERASEYRQRAALLRGRHANENDPIAYVEPKQMQAYLKARNDPLLPAAGLIVEGFLGDFSGHDVAVRLELVDHARVELLLHALADLEKVRRLGAGLYRTTVFGEDAIRDYILEARVATVEEIAEYAEVTVETCDTILGRFLSRGMIEFDTQGRVLYQEPDQKNVARINRRPPENDPPCFSEAVKRGEPVRIALHGKRAKQASVPGQGHKLRMRDLAYQRQQQAVTDRADKQRKKARGQ